MRQRPGAASRRTTPSDRRRGIRSAAAATSAIQAVAARARSSTSSTTTRSGFSRRRKQTPSLVDAKTDYSNASPEVQVAVDRARAADLGVRMATIGNTLRLMVAGDDEISTYREAGEQYPVKIRVLESQRRDIDTVGKLTVTSPSGAAGPDRQHRAAGARLRADPHHRARTGSIRSTSTPTSRPATRSTRRPSDRAPPHRRPQAAAGLQLSGCRGRRRISTRPPTT